MTTHVGALEVVGTRVTGHAIVPFLEGFYPSSCRTFCKKFSCRIQGPYFLSYFDYTVNCFLKDLTIKLFALPFKCTTTLPPYYLPPAF